MKILQNIKSIGNISIEKFLLVALFAALLVFTSSCYKEDYWVGADGNPGRAFLALTWSGEKPIYLDAGTGAIPYHFEYGRHYRAYPGLYTLYYESEVWESFEYVVYAWEVDYEIIQFYGEEGGPYYHGRDGKDSYLEIDCNPYGPYLSTNYKDTGEEKFKLLERSDDKIVIEKGGESFALKITYKRVTRR